MDPGAPEAVTGAQSGEANTHQNTHDKMDFPGDRQQYWTWFIQKIVLGVKRDGFSGVFWPHCASRVRILTSCAAGACAGIFGPTGVG